MIIWSGFGFLVGIIGFAGFLMANLLVGAVFQDDHYYEAHGWPKLAGLWLAALIVWPIGRWFNSGGERELIDPKTGEKVILGSGWRHTLFFVPMEYWAFIFLLLGVFFMFGPSNTDSKSAIVLPKDTMTVIVRFDPGVKGFGKKRPEPYLQIQADGAVIVTNPDGSKKESMLTRKELDDLLLFIIDDNHFFELSDTKITDAIKAAAKVKREPILLGDVSPTVIEVQADGKRGTVVFRGASGYLRVYPKIGVLAQFVAIENRLTELAESVVNGK